MGSSFGSQCRLDNIDASGMPLRAQPATTQPFSALDGRDIADAARTAPKRPQPALLAERRARYYGRMASYSRAR